jgi:hypothetical protein
MVLEFGLVNFHSDDHVNIALIVSRWDESLDWPESFDIYVCVDSTFDVHDKVSKKIRFDNLGSNRFVHEYYVGSIQSVWSEVGFDIVKIILISQDFIPV